MPKHALRQIDFRNGFNPHGLRFIEGEPDPAPKIDAPAPTATPDPGTDGKFVDPDTGEIFDFPESTLTADMTAEQRAEYWRHKAQKHEKQFKARADYYELKRKADKLDKAQRDAETEHEKALREAREAAKAEGREEATKESRQGSIRALLDVSLRSRGQNDEQVEEALRYLNLDAFVTDTGEVDTKAILNHATRLAGTPSGTPDYGAGRRGGSGNNSGVAAGREMFTAGKK